MRIGRYKYCQQSRGLLLVQELALFSFLVVVPATAQLLHPSDLTYEGLIAPPQLSGSGPRFGYGMFGLEYDPTCAGQPDPSPSDGYPGCLVGTSHKNYNMVAMFDIPEPQQVPQDDYDSIRKGSLMVDFFKCTIRANGSDIQDDLEAEEGWTARDIPGVARSESGDWLCTCGHDWYDVSNTDYDSHCWFNFSPSGTDAKGAYGFGAPGDLEFHSQRMAWYLGSVPQVWADDHLAAGGESYCFSGMQRAGGGCAECSAGPSIYAFPCSRPSEAAPGPLMSAVQLLGYPNVYPMQVFDKLHPDYSPKSQAKGAVWVDDAVVVSARKGGDFWWYGQQDPWTDPFAHRNTCLFNQGGPEQCFLDTGPNLPPGTKDNCDTSKGFHAVIDPNGSAGPQITATLQFYDANELAQVANGQRPPESVLPYTSLEGPAELWIPNCAEPGDLAYDAANRKLYWVQLNKERPLIHVYTVQHPGLFLDGFESGNTSAWTE